MNEPPTDDAGGLDSVQAVHGPVMDAMNEEGLVGTDPLPGGRDRDGMPPSAHDLPTRHVLMREKAEPKDGFEPTPFWAYLIYGGLLMWGGFYVGTKSGPMTDTITVFGVEVPWFDSRTFDRSDLAPAGRGGGPPPVEPDPQTLDELKKVGGQVYANICQACHQPNGVGNPAQGIPPLSGSEWVAGPEASAARLSRVVLYGVNGPLTVNGRAYNGLMPAQGGALKDYQIAGVLTYVRNTWGNAADPTAPAVTTAAVKAARAKEVGRSTSGSAAMTEAQLKLIPVALSETAPPAKKEPGK